MSDGISITFGFDGMSLNGVPLSAPFLPSQFSEIVGLMPRVYTGSIPAPVGHRNNWRYLYDHLGIGLVDQHDTQLVTEVEVFLRPSRPWEEHEPKSTFNGRLTVLDVNVEQNPTALLLLTNKSNMFEQRTPGYWSCRRNRFAIGLVASAASNMQFRERTAALRSVAFGLREREPTHSWQNARKE